MNSARNLFIAALSCILTACGGGDGEGMGSPTPSTGSAPWLVKGSSVDTRNQYETTPVLWDGEVLHVYCKRDDSSGIVVATPNGEIVSAIPAAMNLCSAIVVNGELMVFGRGPGGVNMVKTSDLTTWSAPVVVWTPPEGMELYNVGISTADYGYVMAYEMCTKGMACQNIRFLRSADLLKWIDVGGQYKPGSMSACPTMRWVNGWHYMFFVAWSGTAFNTHVARSRDLITWGLSKQTALAPDGIDGPLNAGNASDFDFVEHNGQVQFVYMNFNQFGNHIPGTGLRQGVYAGTVEQMVKEFFE